MEYSVVVVTRNRRDALKLSLPLLVGQSRPPLEVIVVDSTDDPAPIRAIVDEVARSTPIPVEYIHSAPGMTVQRNIGLGRVKGEVTLFPDDDSLLFPDAMQRIMQIYERDSEGLVGGVCGTEVARPPQDIAGAAETSYAREARTGAAGLSFRRRRKLKARLVADPFAKLADRKYARLRAPGWLAAEEATLVGHMTGFRMSFRTEVIRRLRFDENLGRYALFEDVDASLRVLDTHCLVAANRARVYHHKVPGSRDAERTLGAMHILNRGYVLSKHKPLGRRIVSDAYLFCFYKILGYGMGLRSRFGRDRLRSAFAAYRALPELFAASPEQLATVYRDLRVRCVCI
jgi:glycosyltransferase involved in cell wall biosynthesis